MEKLAKRLHLPCDISEEAMLAKLKEYGKILKKKIMIQLAIKEGVENMKQVLDGKHLLIPCIEEANSSIEELNRERDDVKNLISMITESSKTRGKCQNNVVVLKL